VSYVGFVSIAILLWLFLFVAARASPRESTEAFWWLSLVGAGYFGGALFRCDPGAPLIGSWQNTLHMVFGVAEYLGAAVAFSMLKFEDFWAPLSNVLEYAGGVVCVCLVGMSFPHAFRGLIQRVAESIIFAGVVLMGVWVYRGSV
jgi:hypothetical protein